MVLLSPGIPLVVDLDGTLIRTDSLLETLFAQVKERPRSLLALRHGRAALKRALAEAALPDIDTLPYHTALLDWLREQKRRGRRLVLATGADERVAQRVAEHLGLFDEVLASDGTHNLAGDGKRERLVAAFGERGFDYAGNSVRDLPVWRAARRVVVVSAPPGLAAALRRVADVEEVFGGGRTRPAVYLEELRWHHWLKNLLVFVPLLFASRLHDVEALWAVGFAFAGFCLAASSVYLLNDLVDLPFDRRDPHKRQRPLASGRIALVHGVALVPLLWLAAAAISTQLPGGYAVTLVAYVLAMLAYTLRLKDWRFVDAALLGAGYTLRLLAGASAAQIAVSGWLCAWSMPMFFGLALLKRRAELAVAATREGPQARSRGYVAGDARLLERVGRSVGMLAVAVLVVHPLVEPLTTVRAGALWLACVVLLDWTLHLWRRAAAGAIRGDPVRYALRDARSRAAGVVLLVLALATA